MPMEQLKIDHIMDKQANFNQSLYTELSELHHIDHNKIPKMHKIYDMLLNNLRTKRQLNLLIANHPENNQMINSLKPKVHS